MVRTHTQHPARRIQLISAQKAGPNETCSEVKIDQVHNTYVLPPQYLALLEIPRNHLVGGVELPVPLREPTVYPYNDFLQTNKERLLMGRGSEFESW